MAPPKLNYSSIVNDPLKDLSTPTIPPLSKAPKTISAKKSDHYISRTRAAKYAKNWVDFNDAFKKIPDPIKDNYLLINFETFNLDKDLEFRNDLLELIIKSSNLQIAFGMKEISKLNDGNSLDQDLYNKLKANTAYSNYKYISCAILVGRDSNGDVIASL